MPRVRTSGPDDDPKRRRLAFYKDDIERITSMLRTFRTNTHSRAIIIVTLDGHLVTKEGEATAREMDSISALATEANADAERMAAFLDGITLVEGNRLESFRVWKSFVLVALHADPGSRGMIRLYGNQVAAKLTELFEEISRRGPDPGERVKFL